MNWWDEEIINLFNYKKLSTENCEFVPVATETDFANEDRLFIEVDGDPIVIFKVAGKYFAIGDVCSHDDGPLGDGELENDFEISCPRHGAHFDIKTGKALTYPAVVDIPAYPVRVFNGEIEIGLPLED